MHFLIFFCNFFSPFFKISFLFWYQLLLHLATRKRSNLITFFAKVFRNLPVFQNLFSKRNVNEGKTVRKSYIHIYIDSVCGNCCNQTNSKEKTDTKTLRTVGFCWYWKTDSKALHNRQTMRPTTIVVVGSSCVRVSVRVKLLMHFSFYLVNFCFSRISRVFFFF